MYIQQSDNHLTNFTPLNNNKINQFNSSPLEFLHMKRKFSKQLTYSTTDMEEKERNLQQEKVLLLKWPKTKPNKKVA